MKRKRLLGILLSLVMLLGLMPGMSLTAYAASSGKNGGFNWTLNDDGKMTVTGSGALPENFINQNGDIKSIVFDENCQVSGLAQNSIYWANNATEIIINSTADLTIAGTAIRYSGSSGGDPVSITINAPKVTIAGSKPFYAYNRQLNITVNTNELIVYNGTMSYLGQKNSNNSFAYPANSTVYIPAGYVFTDSSIQEEYDSMVQSGMEDMFWQDYGETLTEGRDYTYNAEASSVALTSENAGTVFGGAQTSSSNAYTAAHNHSFTYSASGATITASCGADGCTLPASSAGAGDHVATLTIAAPESLAYDGNPKAATITDENSIQGDAKVMYQKKIGESSYDTETETAPTDAGTYKASITLGEGDGAKTASVEYTITATPLTITGATLTSRDYVKDKKDVEVTAVTFSGGSPTINTDFTATAEMADDKAGENKAVTVTVTLSNTNYSLATNTFATTVKINKATPAAPAAPTAASKTDTSVTLKATDGYQYKRDDGEGWQDSNVFTGLAEDTRYNFYQRVKGDANHNDSASSPSALIRTKQEPIDYAVVSKSGNKLIITIRTLTEYIKAVNTDHTVWLDEGDFYVVKDNVTLNRGLVYSGKVSILLCDGATLTIKGGIWHYGSELNIYGQSGQSGQIVVQGDKDITLNNVPDGVNASSVSKDSALDGGTININGGKFSVIPGADQNVCGTNATVSFMSNVSLTGTTAGGEVTLTEGTYGAAALNQFTTFVTKESAAVKTEPTAKSLTENGSAQQLVTAGEAEHGTMQYALGKDATTVPTSGWDAAIPTGTNAGTYYVWYKAKGDDTHGDSLPVCVTVRIANQGGGSSGGGSAAETAQQVADKINDLPDVSALTLKDADAVAAARAEFNKLSEEDKLKVSKEALKKLRDAEAKIAELKKADEDQKAAGEVSKQIEALPAAPAEAGEADAQAAFDAFMKLTDAQKALLSDDAKQKVAAYKYFYEVKYAEAQKVKMSSAKAKKGGKAVVKWKKNKAADGYRLYYKAKGVKAKYVNIKSSKTVKTTVKKLKDGKVYSFKVRPYTKVNDPSTGKAKNVYGKWSKVKKIKAKK